MKHTALFKAVKLFKHSSKATKTILDIDTEIVQKVVSKVN